MSNLRDRYIEMRNKKIIDINFLHSYAIHGGMSLSHEEFLLGLNYLDIDNLLSKLDKEYELCTLFDCDGMFVKVIDNPM
jgi:hypothetical protein